MEKEKKVLKSFKIEQSIWDEFKEDSPNVSECIRDLLQCYGNPKKGRILNELYYCKLCDKQIHPEEALGFLAPYDSDIPKEKRRIIMFIVCSRCVETAVKEGQPKINEDTETEAVVDRKIMQSIVLLSYNNNDLMKPEKINTFFEMAVDDNFMFWDFFKSGFETPTIEQWKKRSDDMAEQSKKANSGNPLEMRVNKLNRFNGDI